jgi:alpha-beta hydrolase superfamily lysophospholipase
LGASARDTLAVSAHRSGGLVTTTYGLTAGHELVFWTVAAALLLAGALEPRMSILQRARVNFVALGLLVVVVLYGINAYKTAFHVYNIIG